MKKTLLIFFVIFIALPNTQNAQDRSALRAARMSFDAAEKNHKASNYQEAAQEYTIVVNTIPVSTDSRRYLEIRMQSLIGLVDIHFNKKTNFEKACHHVHLYLNDMEIIKAGDVLRASDRLDYLRKEQEYINNHIPKCESYKRLDQDAEEFKKHFDDRLQ